MSSQRILVVDDYAAFRMSLKVYLEDCGYEVIEAFDAEEAIELLKKESFDLVITDLAMPKDGIYLIEFLNEKYPGVPVILITGTTKHSSVYDHWQEKCSDLNIYKIIEKPLVNMEAVELSIQQALDPSILARVLIVDTEYNFTQDLSSYLTKRGFLVYSATDSYDGFKIFGIENPEVVMTCLHMDGMNGYDLIKHIREHSPRTLIIAISDTDDFDKYDPENKTTIEGSDLYAFYNKAKLDNETLEKTLLNAIQCK